MGSLWNRSGTIERYAEDLPAAGAQAFFYVGGTTTLFTVYSDAGESAAFASPVQADASGRWPAVFVPYTLSFDVKVLTADGVQLTFTQLIPNPNPVDVTITVPPEQIINTGMFHGEFVNTTKTGYVRLNGRTIGTAASGATERANGSPGSSDTEALFTYLWNNLLNTIAPVSGGRGGTAAADFAANKTIMLPDCRGRALIGLDDMGNTAAGAFTGLTFDLGSATDAGSTVGINRLTLTAAQMPAHTHGGSTSVQAAHFHTITISGTTDGMSADHSHTYSGTTSGESNTHTHAYTEPAVVSVQVAPTAGVAVPQGPSAGTTGANSLDHSHTYSGSTSGVSAGHTHTVTLIGNTGFDGGHSHTFTTDAQGGGQPFTNLGLSALVTWFIKL